MKKLSLIILSLIVLFAVACSGDSSPTSNTNDDNDTETTTNYDLTIKGSFFQTTTSSNILTNTTSIINVNDISKVIVFSTGGTYVSSSVENGKFSIGVSKGDPVGVIFVGSTNNYLGYLSLQDGIDAVPLTKIKSGTTIIDLETLTISGNIVTSSHNPLGNEIVVSSEDKEIIAGSDDMFASIIRNPDMDGNGQIDFLEKKFFHATILYYINGGTFSGYTVDISSSLSIGGYKIAFSAYDENNVSPDNVTFTGASSSNLNGNSETTKKRTYRGSYYSPYVSNPSIPPTGEYKISYNGSTLSFAVSDQASSENHIIIAVPTVVLNDDETIKKITWIYKTKNGSVSANPKAIISEIEVQIDGNGTKTESDLQDGRMYDSGNLSIETLEHTLKYQTVKWREVTKVHMAYNDVFGNHNVVTYNKTN